MSLIPESSSFLTKRLVPVAPCVCKRTSKVDMYVCVDIKDPRNQVLDKHNLGLWPNLLVDCTMYGPQLLTRKRTAKYPWAMQMAFLIFEGFIIHRLPKSWWIHSTFFFNKCIKTSFTKMQKLLLGAHGCI